MNKESWTGVWRMRFCDQSRFLDPVKVATAELKICGRCWNSRNSPVGQHDCEAFENYMVSDSAYLRLCDCPCVAMSGG